MTESIEFFKRALLKIGRPVFRALKDLRLRISEFELMRAIGNPSEERPLLVIFVWTPGRIELLRRIERIPHLATVLWLGEPPVRDPLWEPTFPHFDRVFIVDHHEWTRVLAPENQARAKVLPLSGDETIFKPLSEKDPAYACDVSFIGKYVPRRAEMLAAIQDRDLRIYGFDWEKGFADHPWLKRRYYGPVKPEQSNQIYNNSKIVIGTLGAPQDPFTSATQRTFEISLAGAFQISEKIALIEEIFQDSIKFYRTAEDMKGLVDTYLADDAERSRFAAKACGIAQDHSYGARARQILRTFDLA